jgi:NAD(P)H-dependent FMN reductase
MEQAQSHGKFELELVDLAEVNLPLLDEPQHPKLRQYEHEHTLAWSRTVSRADAYVFVTSEYDFGPPASLINAMQYLLHEWSYKPLGLVTYGGVSGGTRSAQTIKLTATALKMMPMVEAVSIPFFTQHIDKESGAFDPGDIQAKAAVLMLDELYRWAEALLPMRAPRQ